MKILAKELNNDFQELCYYLNPNKLVEKKALKIIDKWTNILNKAEFEKTDNEIDIIFGDVAQDE